MKYLIVGLGNIGAEYYQTRHNIGFEVMDTMVAEAEVGYKIETLGSIAEIKHKGRTFVLLKPNTYMNLSGKAVRYWMQKLNISQENILIVLDDLALPMGKIRLRAKGSAGGHNGLKNIDLLLGNNNYARLRLGIGNEFDKGRQVDFVLGKWDEEEQKRLPDILKTAALAIKSFGTIGLAFTMTQFNK